MSDMNEKPTPEQRFSNYAILGRYVLTPEIFDILENVKPGYGGEIQLTDGLRELCRRSRMVAVDFEGRRYDTGNLCGFLEATIDFALDHPATGAWLKGFLEGEGRDAAPGALTKEQRNAAPRHCLGPQTGENLPGRKASQNSCGHSRRNNMKISHFRGHAPRK